MIPKHKLISLCVVLLPLFCMSQENSPYSRYGIGNLVPQGNILNRTMGGISAGYSDGTNIGRNKKDQLVFSSYQVFSGGQSINFLNPASYSNLSYTNLDIGAEVDVRTLKSVNPPDKFTATNTIISYVQFGVPLLNGNKKANKKDISWGLNFGLRPVSKINYKVEKFGRISNIDSLATIFEGSGGVNEAFVGSGLRIKNFSFGVNAGYLFGSKDYGTRLLFINDTVVYHASFSQTKTNFGGVFANAGIQYVIDTKKGRLRLGAYGNLQQSYNASQDLLRETFAYNPVTGNPDRQDSVFEQNDIKGKIILPATYGIGFTYDNYKHWLFGVDFETTNWSNYRFYNQTDFVRNAWIVKAGFQFFPGGTSSKYFSSARYRAGVVFGPDYISVDKKLPQYGITAGATFPLKRKQSYYETQYSLLTVGVEYGNRGNTNNNIRESLFRITAGFSLSDIWFRRYKYD